MNCNHLFIVILALVFTQCDATREWRQQSKLDIIIDSIAHIPFSYEKKLIVVEAKLSDRGKRDAFIFDTGAFGSKIEIQLAEEMGLPSMYERENSTAAGITRKVAFTEIDSLRLGPLKILQLGVGKLQYAPSSYSPCVAEAGIIGSNLIRKTHWKIDYQNRMLTAAASPLSPPSSSYRCPFDTDLLSGIPKIDILIEGKRIENVILDVGYNGGLVVPAQYRSEFSSSNQQILFDRSTAGMFGASTDTLFVQTLDVTVGGYSSSIPVEFSTLQKVLLGNDFLEHFDLYLNYEDKVVVLVPISDPTIDAVKTFIPGILSDSLWVVDRTHTGLPFTLGDTLASVRHKKPLDVFAGHCDYFMRVSDFLATDSILVVTQAGDSVLIR